ncbi:MAG: hypothetical protein K2Q45_03250 [Nitrosomonas sp.]|nr:hypothetical protein [Nitrosomonas sp.]
MSVKSVFSWLICNQHRFLLISIVRHYLNFESVGNWIFSYHMRPCLIADFWQPTVNVTDAVKHRFKIYIENEKLLIFAKEKEITLSEFLQPFRQSLHIFKEEDIVEQQSNKIQKL